MEWRGLTGHSGRPQSSEAAISAHLVHLYDWVAARLATLQRNNGSFSLLKQRKQAMYYSVSNESQSIVSPGVYYLDSLS